MPRCSCCADEPSASRLEVESWCCCKVNVRRCGRKAHLVPAAWAVPWMAAAAGSWLTGPRLAAEAQLLVGPLAAARSLMWMA